MGAESRYVDLSLESLRAIGGWAAGYAERALPLYEAHEALRVRTNNRTGSSSLG
jgi:hypothetical protein